MLAELSVTRTTPDAAGGPAPPANTGIEKWRSSPAEEAETFLGSLGGDYARGTLLRELPLHSLAVLFLPPETVPCVGQPLALRLDAGEVSRRRMTALEYAVAFDGGVVACLPEIEGATGLPWGGTAVELRSCVQVGEEEFLVQLRAVSGVRLVTRHPAGEVRGFRLALLQEVPEWGAEEQAAPPEVVAQEACELEELFAQCGELQRRSGFMAAGDFTSKTLRQRTRAALSTLADVRLLRADGADEELDVSARWAAAAAHSAVAALSTPRRQEFLCDPQPLLPRLRRLQAFLGKVRGVLRAKLALSRAFSEDDADGQGS